MQRFIRVLLLAAGFALLPQAGFAQDTNAYYVAPLTRLEALETNTGTIILRATALVGNVAANAGSLTVKCRDFTDTATGRRESGISIDIALGNQREDRLFVDYDEMDSLLNAIDYLNRVDWSVTSFPTFDAYYMTRSGFQLTAFGGRRTGSIEYNARSARSTWPPLALSRDQLAQLRSLVTQAKTQLDAVRKEK